MQYNIAHSKWAWRKRGKERKKEKRTERKEEKIMKKILIAVWPACARWGGNYGYDWVVIIKGLDEEGKLILH